MANPTNPFNWQMPQSTDLVTDLPADFETFGQAVATSMADLLGGTTGQVLSKASNTDMDFTWVAQDDSNAIQNAIVDAKGDLIAASAADTPARLAVGNNGETLVADSSTSTGLRYNPNYTAGKNFAINGGFDIWQRGTSFSTTNGGNGYTADRWTYYGGGTGTITQSTALLRDGAQFALRFTSTSATGNADIYQLMETPNTVQLQGKTITLSVYVAGTAGKTAQVLLGSSTTDNDGLFGSYTTLTASGTSSVTTTGSYQRITAQFTVPSNARTLRLGLNHGALASTEFISWAQTQLEVGSTATNFSRTGGTIQGELAACQRYYWRSNTDVAAFKMLANGITTSSSNLSAIFAISLPVPMRVYPTAFDFANIAANKNSTDTRYTSGTWAMSNGGTTLSGGNSIAEVTYVHGSGVFTAGSTNTIQTTAAANQYIGFSAEL
jgi:hypothetical protein